MAKNSKLKSGKLAKMTEEQKLIYLEQQKLAEEEAVRSKQELISQYLKIKLEKEVDMSRKNQDKLGEEWRQLLRQTKSGQMKKEVKILSQVFEWMMDMKESSLAGVSKDLSEAEEQFMMAKRSHMHNVDCLIDLQRERIGKMEGDFETQKNHLKNTFDSEKACLVEQHDDEVIKMEDIIYAMEETIMDKETEVKAEFQSNLDEIKNRNLEDVHTVRLKHDLMLESLLVMFKESLRNYQEATEERRKSFVELKQKDDINTDKIKAQKNRITQLEKAISKCKVKLATNVKLWVGKNDEASYEKSLLSSELLLMKKKYKIGIKNDNEELARLLLIIKGVQDVMKGVIMQGEKLLKAAERCRKLESEREKVVPVEEEWWGEEDRGVYERMVAQEPREPLTKMMYDYAELENFWKRFNKVSVEKAALEAEVASLSDKNHHLLKSVKGSVLDLVGHNDLPSALFNVKGIFNNVLL